MFEIGQTYKRAWLHKSYGGQRQGGISTPQMHPIVFLFTGKSGGQYGYRDEWVDGIFRYTGEGQSGDMQFRAGNKAIRDHALNGKALHLFEQEKKGYVRYKGEFALSSFEHREGKDRDLKTRRTIVFHLSPVISVEGGAEPDREGRRRAATGPSDLLALRKWAYEAVSDVGQSNPKDGKRKYYERSDAVRDYVLARAGGACESCGKPAPFIRKDGTHYLEPHHTHMISESGPDNPRWVGAICPNCHREIHHGRDGKIKNERLQQHITNIESKFDLAPPLVGHLG